MIGLFVFTEYNTRVPGEKSITLFKRGPRTAGVVEAQEKAGATDEERGKVDARGAEEKLRADSGDSISVPMMTDVFTWRHVQYDVNIKKGETRRLLDDVSGFVAPGKLTALMGESGAGKVCESQIYAEELCLYLPLKTTLLNVLAARQAAGVVHGERLVNGYPLPSDFQAQT